MLYRHRVCASVWACAGQRYSDRGPTQATLKSPDHCSVEPALVAAEQWDQPFTSDRPTAHLMNPAPRPRARACLRDTTETAA